MKDAMNGAFAAVEALEQLPITQPYDAAAAAAYAARNAFEAKAVAAGFPTKLKPMDPCAIQVFVSLSANLRLQTVAAELAQLHLMALDGWPNLSDIIRSPVGFQVLDAALAVAGARVGQSEGAAIDAGRREFRRRVAEQVFSSDPTCQWAQSLAEFLPLIDSRLKAAIDVREVHVASELARIDRENQAADAAVARIRAEQLAAAVSFFSSRPGHAFVVRGEVLSGRAAAEIISGNGAHNFAGDLVGKGFQLQDFELAMRKAQAAEATS